MNYEVSGLRGLPLTHIVVQERMKIDPLLALGGVTSSTAFLSTPAPPPLIVEEVKPFISNTKRQLKPIVVKQIKKQKVVNEKKLEEFNEMEEHNLKGLVYRYENISPVSLIFSFICL